MWRRRWERALGNKARFRQERIRTGGSYSSCPFLCAFGVSLEAASRNVSENKALEIIVEGQQGYGQVCLKTEGDCKFLCR